MVFYLELADAFLLVTFTLKDREFINSLNDPNSDEYRRLSSEVRGNFDKEFSNVPYYNGINAIGFR